jgi:hypothetical protein
MSNIYEDIKSNCNLKVIYKIFSFAVDYIKDEKLNDKNIISITGSISDVGANPYLELKASRQKNQIDKNLKLIINEKEIFCGLKNIKKKRTTFKNTYFITVFIEKEKDEKTS